MAKKHPAKKWPFKFVECIWRDIVTTNEWRSTRRHAEPSVVHEHGWLVHEGENEHGEYIVIAGQLSERKPSEDDPEDKFDMGFSSTIPVGCIISIKETKK